MFENHRMLEIVLGFAVAGDNFAGDKFEMSLQLDGGGSATMVLTVYKYSQIGKRLMYSIS